MSSLVRWDPFREMLSLRDVMDRLVEDAYVRPNSHLVGLHAPAVDMIENEDEIVVKATIPGIRPDDLKITLTGDVLTIRGELTSERENETDRYVMRERRSGSFSRSLKLPTSVVSDQAKAEFEDGILTLTLPKAEEVRPKTITIKAK